MPCSFATVAILRPEQRRESATSASVYVSGSMAEQPMPALRQNVSGPTRLALGWGHLLLPERAYAGRSVGSVLIHSSRSAGRRIALVPT